MSTYWAQITRYSTYEPVYSYTANGFYAGLTYYPIVNSSLKTSEVTIEDPFYKGSFQIGAAFPVTPTH
jgi:hypothetical protein